MAIKSKHSTFSIKLVAPLLMRVAAFLAVFILFSGTIGPRIISHGLVNKDGFQIYGGAGKALLFGAIAFLLLAWRNNTVVELKRWHAANASWLALAVLALVGAWLGVDKLIDGGSAMVWAPIAHTGLLASIIFAAGGTFGPSNLRILFKIYKRELAVSVGLAILFYGFLYIVYGFWRVLATIVLHVVSWLLNLIGIHAAVNPPRTLLLNKFGIDVAQYCSGIESIALFTALYALVGVLDWQRFDHYRFLWIFPLALTVLFIFNIVRVFVLVLGGYYINPRIAFSLFHTYAGMVFFILYSIIFWGVSYKWMLQKQID